MKKILLTFGIVIVLFLIAFSGCIGLGPKVTDFFNAEYDADENTVLKIANINGQIEISTWDNNTIKFDAIKSTRSGKDELDKVDINVNEYNDIIDISIEYTDEGPVKVTVDINIKAPRFVNIDTISTSNGAVQISGTKGNTSASSSNGNIIIEDVDGYVEASTSNGNINVRDCTGVSDLESSNGLIYATIFDFKNDINIKTSNGKITVFINPSLNADIEMKTSNGDIDISGVNLNLTKLEDKHITGKLGEGGNKIDIQTSNGNIYLNKLEI